jgi:DNA-binding MarR family transcriptional regulator
MSTGEISDLILVLWQKWKSASPVRRGAITREQYWILRTLREHGEMKIKDIAAAIGCTAGSASVAVKRLERAGLVRRKRGEKDERVVTVSLEEHGAKKLDAWGEEQLASIAALFEALNRDEKRTLRNLLGKALTVGGDLPRQPSSPHEGSKA